MNRWLLVLLVLLASSAYAQDGATLYQTHCALCHDHDPEARAPSRATLGQLSPQQILTALERGVMSRQGADRSRAERRALAEFLSGTRMTDDGTSAIPPTAYCRPGTAPAPRAARTTTAPGWNGWGVTLENTRFQPASAAGLSAADVPRLELKWAFGFPGASSAGAQPIFWNGRVFVGSWEGDVYALDAGTGCIHWAREVEAGVRSAMSVGRTRAGRMVVYAGDLAANVYAFDAMTGTPVWKVRVDEQPFARITGSPALHEGRLYVPVSSREESQATDPRYPCCRFRGSVVALDATSGRQVWKSYTIDRPAAPTHKTAAGTQAWGPSGSAIWVTPTIDVRAGALYVGTSNSYSAPAAPTSDAIVAFDLRNGRNRWTRQITPGDVWNGSCPERASDHSNCADTDSPDFDFAASPLLIDRGPKQRLLIAAQKSGVVYGLDPDRDGTVVWQERVGRGGTSGGIMWGPAADASRVYVALSDAARKGTSSAFDPEAGGGLFALELASGRRAWHTPPPPCGSRTPCSPSQAAAVTAIPGVVFSGSNDGFLRAFSTGDGQILWQFDTARDFTTVNGVKANGGSINNGGPAVVGGMVFSNAGYSHHSGVLPGNVLLAFAPSPPKVAR